MGRFIELMANALLLHELINANHEGSLTLTNAWISSVNWESGEHGLYTMTFDSAMLSGILYLRFLNASCGADHIIFAGNFLKTHNVSWASASYNTTRMTVAYASSKTTVSINGNSLAVPANTIWTINSHITIQRFE